ncbi:MAG: arginase family protein [Phycisphaerales bacterium]
MTTGTNIPHCKPGVWPDAIAPSRFAAHILQSTPATARVALLGLPDDLGVKLNNGRVGAAQGPTAFRAALAKYGVANPDPQGVFDSLFGRDFVIKQQKKNLRYRESPAFPRVFDAGDVMPAHGSDETALHETHKRVSEASEALVKLGLFPIAIGGGHDLTYAFVRGVAKALDEADAAKSNFAGKRTSYGGLYFDPHLDVRETVGSGMSFRKLLEENIVGGFAIAGFNPFVNSREHVNWFGKHGLILGSDWSSTLQEDKPAWYKYLPREVRIVCSFDLDVLDQSVAPGVSAMNPCGISVDTASKAIAAITRNPSLCCLDFMELSPPHDEGGRTARVAAHLFLVALAGLMQGALCCDKQD